jgi:hypothetical protein
LLQHAFRRPALRRLRDRVHRRDRVRRWNLCVPFRDPGLWQRLRGRCRESEPLRQLRQRLRRHGRLRESSVPVPIGPHPVFRSLRRSPDGQDQLRHVRQRLLRHEDLPERCLRELSGVVIRRNVPWRYSGCVESQAWKRRVAAPRCDLALSSAGESSAAVLPTSGRNRWVS